jgi:hypothetical protein
VPRGSVVAAPKRKMRTGDPRPMGRRDRSSFGVLDIAGL